VIVDDHVDVRELLTLRRAMVPGVVLVGQAANGSDALELARTISPELMILDLRMPVMGGVEAIPLLVAVAPKMRIVVYTLDNEGADLSGGGRSDAVVLKGANLRQLVDVILGVLAEGPQDVLSVNLGRLPVDVAVAAFDSWVGLNTRVRQALATKGDVSTELLGDVLPLNSSELLC
jgi:DNA-binding NarL/FixJ family response regulator